MKKLLMVAGALVASAALAGPAHAQSPAPEPTVCDGTLAPGVYDDVSVGLETSCVLDRVLLRGDVIADGGGVLELRIRRSVVAGDVNCVDCDVVELRDSVVRGVLNTVEVDQGTEICRSAIGGPTRIGFSVGVRVGGSPGCAGSVFGAPLSIDGNRDLEVAGSLVRGDVEVNQNFGAITLRDSAFAGALNCSLNLQVPTVTNVAAQARTGQCAAL